MGGKGPELTSRHPSRAVTCVLQDLMRPFVQNAIAGGWSETSIRRR